MKILKKIFGSPSSENETEQTETRRKNQAETLKYDGIRAKQIHEYAIASRCLGMAFEMNPDDMETCSYLAEVYIYTGESEKAWPLLQRLNEQEPQNIKILLAMGQVAARLEMWQETDEACQKALQIDEQLPAAYLILGHSAHRQGDDIMAIAHLTKAITLDETLDEAFRQRAEVLCSMGQYNESRKDADTLIKRQPEGEAGWMLKGDIERNAGLTAEAINAYAQVRRLNPFNGEAFLKEGDCLLAENKPEQALSLYNEAIELQPDFTEAYKARGNAKMLLGDKNGALEDLKKTLELSPNAEDAIKDGEYSNIENEIENKYKQLNPYGF